MAQTLLKVRDVILDWSGVISDDFSMVYETCMVLMERYGGHRMPKEQFRQEFELPYMNFWHRYFPNLEKAAHDRNFEEVWASMPQRNPCPGAVEALQRLHADGFHLWVVSSTLPVILVHDAERFGVGNLFEEIRGDEHDKVERLAHLLRDRRLDPRQTLYVGDMTHDIEAGKASGVLTAAVTTGYDAEEKLARLKPDILVENLSALPARLRML